MSVLARVAFVAFLTITVGLSAAFGQDRNSITGFVFGENRAPLSRIYVELQTDLYSTVGRTQTSGAGMYSFRGLPSGQYVVKVLATGTNYEEQSIAVSLVPISVVAGRGSVAEQVDFYLKVRKTENPLAPPEVVFAQSVPEEAEKLYKAGLEALEKKDEATGYEKLKHSLEVFPDYFLALDRLGNEYLTKGYYQASFVLFTKAVEVNPKSVSSTLGLGISEFKLNRIPRSIELLKTVRRLHKSNVTAFYWLGVAYHASGNFSEALKSLLEGDKLSGGQSADFQWQLARVYKDKGDYQLASDALEKYLSLKPDIPNAAEIRTLIATLRQKR